MLHSSCKHCWSGFSFIKSLSRQSIQKFHDQPLAMANPNNIIKLTEETRKNNLKLAYEALHKGGVIALPTDTIYGLAALSGNTEAVQKIYKIKGRDFCKPLAVAVSDVQNIKRWVECTVSEELLNDLLPGPVTLVFNRLPSLNSSLNPFTNLIGIRITCDSFLTELSSMCSSPLALTSANKSAAESALNVQEFTSLWKNIDVIFDGGVIRVNNSSKEGSTVVDLSSPPLFRIIRTGCALEQTVKILQKHGLKVQS